MKQRFTYLDVRAIVNELNPLILNTYIQNIYSPTNKQYIFKLSSKHLLLIEPGVRMHLTTSYDNTQTHFNIIARKYLRRNIIKDISQIGFDRVIRITTNKHIIYVEFFAAGNIVITDFENVIIDLWRTVKEVKIEKGEVYVTNEVVLDFGIDMMYKVGVREMVGLDRQINEGVRDEIEREIRRIGYCLDADGRSICELISEDDKSGVKKENTKMDGNVESKEKEIVDADRNIEQYRSSNRYCEKESVMTNSTDKKDSNTNRAEKVNENFVDETIHNREGSKNADEPKTVIICPNDRKSTDQLIDNAVNKHSAVVSPLTLEECKQNSNLMAVYNNCITIIVNDFKNTANIGTLLYVKNKPNTFIPYKLENVDSLPSLNEALLIYYQKEEKVVKSKSNVVKDKQEGRIKELEEEIILCDRKVNLMYEHQVEIEQILMAHKSVIDYNLDWKEFEDFKNEQEDLKHMIEKSDFKNKTVILKVNDVKIVCDFMQNFNANINKIYDLKRKIKEKTEKTIKNIKKVVKSVEKKENKAVKKKVKIERRIYWFEKFHYFIYKNKLIIGGKNAQQNDIIVKKYFTPNDLYFHADTHGASSVILKNGLGSDDDLLSVTGLVALCNSNCWKTKVTGDVYYVQHEQVSKTAESGEYLSTGSFIIRGKKKFVDVFRLEYGIGLLFRKKLDLNELDALKIKEEDNYTSFLTDPENFEIEHALVICGPWVVIKTYKYNEKLLPGVDKKGKLVTEIMKRFANKLKDCCNDSEANAVKNLTHDEYMNVIINNSKIGKK